jgi:hypothetical protein
MEEKEKGCGNSAKSVMNDNAMEYFSATKKFSFSARR